MKGSSGPGDDRGGRSPSRSDPRDPSRTPEALERLETLVHEMANLLDGSMRWLELAGRSIGRMRVAVRLEPTESEATLRQAGEQIETAREALERMADLVHAAMQNSNVPLGSRLLSNCDPVGLFDALTHAVNVVAPEAADHGIAVRVDIESDLRSAPAGAIYSVVLNALKNSLEAIVIAQRNAAARLGRHDIDATGGAIEVIVTRGVVRSTIVIEIRDDGVGPPNLDDPTGVFEHGFTTKPDGTGIGLALARSIVRDSGGTIRLVRREDRSDPARPGAILRIVIPEGSHDMETFIGQARSTSNDTNEHGEPGHHEGDRKDAHGPDPDDRERGPRD